MNLSSLDLNLLLVLDAVLQERSVVRAAQRLHVTPPAVSNALSRLRSALGDAIVIKSGRGIVPTPRALRLGPVVARALRDVDGALNEDVFDPKTAQVQFTLAVGDAGQLARLPALSSAVVRELPRARLRVVGVDTMVALGGLAGTEVDAAIGVSPRAPGIRRLPIYEEHSVLVVRREHPRIGQRASKRALAGELYIDVHVAFERPSRPVERGFAQLGIERAIAAVVPTFAAAAAIAARTDFIAAIPASVASVLGPALGLRVVASPLRIGPIQMHLSWHERTHEDRAMSLFRDIIARSAST
jgi:DNA-binding transcriptional LysR family regulator